MCLYFSLSYILLSCTRVLPDQTQTPYSRAQTSSREEKRSDIKSPNPWACGSIKIL